MTKAMILAAGQGTRIRPLTKGMPKPMIPILGKPVLEYIIEHLARHGVREIMINVAYHHWKIENYFGDGSRWGVEIGYSYEGVREHGEIVPRPKGSAGGMRHIQDFSGFFDDTTLVLCGDAIIDLDITAALEEHHAKKAMATVVTLPVSREEVKNYGVVVAGDDGRVQSFQEKPKPEEALSNLASTGIYIFEPAVLELVPRGVEFDIGSQLFPLLVKQGLPFFAQSHPFHWIDIGRVTDYWTVLQRVLKGEIADMRMPGKEVRPGVWVGLNTRVNWDKVNITGPVYIGSGSDIEDGVTIEGPAWLGNGCQLRAGSHLVRSVLFDYTRLNAGATFTDVIASPLYVVDRGGHTTYQGEEGTALRWGDARA
ncbi:mannose-1-phosphate guanyltransferase [Aquabacterium olei]|uniref:Mannose-1-phosphate guanyltransferase n=2 Tax=Aquabacterium olei TaxID=1296669 RepID=A0A2U8FTV7_9BURK|nr:mannose-1-phosphate guanyltransferase [Aquabacterium olei]